jgi:hypothetical protein
LLPGRALVGFALAGLALATPASLSAVAGTEVSVSRLPATQNEPSLAIDPSDDRILLAGSNSAKEGTMRLYGSTDGGVTWATSTAYPPPSSLAKTCAADPWVGIDSEGRQYLSFVRFTPCRTGAPRVQVVTRAGPGAQWTTPKVVAPLGTARFDDKPSLAVDTSGSSPNEGRVYVAWVRASRKVVFGIRLSHSDDGGRTWSRPVNVSRQGREVTYPSIAVSARGYVYVAWDDATNYRIQISRSTDGGAHFAPERTVAQFSIVPIPHCGSGVVIRALPGRCVRANPIVSVDRSRGPFAGRVYVSYAGTGVVGSAGAFVRTYDGRLRELPFSRRSEQGIAVGATGGRLRGRSHPDQFWPQSAVDASSGALWVCLYDTWADRAFTSAFFSCAASRTGGRTFSRLVKAASVASDETQPGADAHGYGDYEGLAVANGVAHPMWTDSRDLPELGEEIYTAALTENDLFK